MADFCNNFYCAENQVVVTNLKEKYEKKEQNSCEIEKFAVILHSQICAKVP